MPFGFIGVPRVDQLLRESDHLVDIIRRARLRIRSQRVQLIHIFMKDFGGADRQLFDRNIAFFRARQNLVVHIRDVAGIGDLGIMAFQQAIERVEHHDRPRIAKVGIVINRRAAHIHADMRRIDRLKLFFGSGQRVVDVEGGHE